ncbi:hypothetical protein DFR70_10456 [Nocardia tenerifensis]|uniref:Uncharacterized protein n=1 Tax=Nocardia tenerifensis TaxID=228006 RepID=A0A318K706_9NOCA|nr:hypothetical protein [Nocardia tenerifensis]PXX64995.1 hypothetical protein DFR70_10456 [Nocardia tenerifensis]
MRKILAAAALAPTLLIPLQLTSAATATAAPPAATATGSAEIPPSCVGKIDPIQFYIQSLFGTQPRHCL